MGTYIGCRKNDGTKIYYSGQQKVNNKRKNHSWKIEGILFKRTTSKEIGKTDDSKNSRRQTLRGKNVSVSLKINVF